MLHVNDASKNDLTLWNVNQQEKLLSAGQCEKGGGAICQQTPSPPGSQACTVVDP